MKNTVASRLLALACVLACIWAGMGGSRAAQPDALPPPSPEPQGAVPSVQPLQGAVQQIEAGNRFGGAPMRSSIIDTATFSGLQQGVLGAPGAPGRVLSAGTVAGQDEYWVNWDDWRHRVADAVIRPLEGSIMYGTTRVDYDVTRDRRIHVTSISTPDPSGASGRSLARAIMRLDGDPIFEFPPGSQQQVHHNYNAILGPPMKLKVATVVHLPGGTEHITRQW